MALLGQLGVAATFKARNSIDANMGMASLQFFHGENITAYLTVAKGYKGTGIAFGEESVGVLEPEEPLNIEVGTRASVFDKRAYISPTFFPHRL